MSMLRPITMVLACLFGLLLLPQILLMVQLTVYSLVEAKLNLQTTVPIVAWPLFQLGIPAILFLSSAHLLRQQNDGWLVRLFEVIAIILVAVMGYYVTRNSLHPDENVLFIKAGFIERGIVTNILFSYGLLGLWIGRRFGRIAFSGSGVVICSVAIFRILYFDMLIYNPLWHSQEIAGIAILNSLWLPFGLTILWSYLSRQELAASGWYKSATYMNTFMLGLVFVLLSLQVRHFFHGEYLNIGTTTHAEVYAYSAAWLVFGLGLLFGGILQRNRMLRYAALSVISLTVGKVFLYDASELEGLYRVFSFFGLGLCLIGLSYFYARFVTEPK